MQRWRSLKDRAICGGKAQPAAAAHPTPTAGSGGACPSAAHRCTARPDADSRMAVPPTCGATQLPGIHAAAAAGDRRAVAALVARSPHLLDSEDGHGCTPLFLAVGNGQLGTVEELLAAGADADAGEARSGRTPLHVAAAAPRGERLVRALLHAGASPAARDRHGCTPLHAAVAAVADSRSSSSAVACLLCLARRSTDLLHGAAADGTTPLHAACRSATAGGLQALQALAGARVLTQQSLSTADASGATPLAYAVAAGNLRAVEVLLAAGADPNCHSCPCCRQQTGCMAAAAPAAEAAAEGASWGSLEALRCTTAPHTCPLGLAAGMRGYDTLLLLLRAGASAAQLGTHVLGHAIADGHADVAAALVAGQCDGSAARPLAAAVERGDAALLAALLDAGLDPNCPGDPQGAERLLHAVLRPGCEHLLAELVPPVPRPQQAQCSSSSRHRRLDVAGLARRLQRNPALFAVRHSSPTALQALLAAGCPPGAVPLGSACPPLVAAAGQLDAARCRQLLQAGARADELSVAGETALDAALFICTDLDLVRLAAEASPGAAPPTGEQALLQLVELLCGAGARCHRFAAEQCAARRRRGSSSGASAAAAAEPPAGDAGGWGLVHPSLALAAGLVRWSPATHHCWPRRFRAAAAAALLALRGRGVAPPAASAAGVARSSGGHGRRRGPSACHLPPELCHLVLSHAAATVSAWVPG